MAFENRQNYRIGDDDWRCERFDLLQAEFPTITPEQLPAFHGAVSLDAGRWQIARRLFGIWPHDPSTKGYDIDTDFRLYTRAEVLRLLTLTESALRGELKAIAGIWLHRGEAVGRLAQKVADERRERSANFKGELDLKVQNPDEVLRRFGFDPGIFEIGTRSAEENRKEKEDFAARVLSMERPLTQPASAPLTRRLILNQLDLSRAESDYYRMAPTDGNRKAVQKLRQELQTEEREITAQLHKVASWFFAIGENEMNMQASFSLLIQAMQVMRGRGDPALADAIEKATGIRFEPSAELIDGIFDAEEIVGMTRMSEEALRSGQAPQYDPGWVAFLLMVKERLFDPACDGKIERRRLGVIRQSFAKALEDGFRESAITIPQIIQPGVEWDDQLSSAEPPK